MTDGLTPATPGRHGQAPYRQTTVDPARSVHARIDGRWVGAVIRGQRQPQPGGVWEVCLEYRTGTGSTHLGWFVVDHDQLRLDPQPGDPGQP